MAASRYLYIDDRDPAIRYYSMSKQDESVWRPWEGAEKEFMQTTTGAEMAGAAANLTFVGSSVTVVGTVSQISFRQPPTIKFTVDGAGERTVHPTAHDDSLPQYNFTFYQSPTPLGPGSHTLQMITQDDGAFFLDYIIVSGGLSISAGTDSSSSSGSKGDPTPTPSAFSSPSPTTSTDSPDESAKSNSTSGAVIAAGVLGGVFGLVLFVLLGWCIWKRRTPPLVKSQQSSGARIMDEPFHGELMSSAPTSGVTWGAYGTSKSSHRLNNPVSPSPVIPTSAEHGGGSSQSQGSREHAPLQEESLPVYSAHGSRNTTRPLPTPGNLTYGRS